MKKLCCLMMIILSLLLISCSDWVELPMATTSKSEGASLFSACKISECNIPANMSCIHNSTAVAGLCIVGTFDGKIYFSKDGGTTWELKSNLDKKINFIKDYQYNDFGKKVIYIGSDDGLWEFSTDGNNKTRLLGNSAGITARIKNISISTSTHTSTNLGQTTSSSLSKITCIGSEGNFDKFYSSDNGATWTKSKLFPKSNSNPVDLVYLSGSDNIYNAIYYSPEDKTIFCQFKTSSDNKLNELKSELNSVSHNGYYLSTNTGKYFCGWNGIGIIDYNGLNVMGYDAPNFDSYYLVNNDIYVMPNGGSGYSVSIPGNNISFQNLMTYNNKIVVSTKEGKSYYLTFEQNPGYYVDVLFPTGNETVGNDITLSWFGYSIKEIESNSYGLQVSTSEYFTSYVLNINNYKGYSYRLSNLESGKRYFWRICLEKNGFLFPYVKSYFTVK